MSVRAECKKRFGDVPCIRTYKTTGELVEAIDCVIWCPALNKLIDDDDYEACDEERR